MLVIGDGLAGSAAALEAARLGASVALVSAAHGSSDRAQGGIAAATLPEDSPRLHALDTLAAGGDLCDPSAVAMLTSAGPATVLWLESLGVRFDGARHRRLRGAIRTHDQQPDQQRQGHPRSCSRRRTRGGPGVRAVSPDGL